MMQLGTRWAVGAEPPARLTPEIVAAIRSVEAEITHLDTAQWRWTLTWLEGRPVVELDDGTVIRLGHDGDITVAQPDDAESDDESFDS